MRVEELKALSPIERVIYWVSEREKIRRSKEANLPKPWTENEILQSYRFCNVRRADDKVSRWLIQEWYTPYFNHKNMLGACFIARHFNKIEVLDAITKVVFAKQYKPEVALKIIQGMKEKGQTVFSAAYMIHADKSADKSEMVINRVIQPIIDKPPPFDTSSMQACVESLQGCWNIGSFMAGQIVADARWAIEGTWEDKLTWAPLGPGSLRGMNRIHSRDIKYPLKQEQFLEELRELYAILKKRLPKIANRIELHDAQNVCCETDKFNRVLFGEGRPKQLYKGT